MTPASLPCRVTLPKAAMISAAHLQAALDASRAVISLWRKHGGFPRSHRDKRGAFTMTDDVQRWCEAHGSIVTRK